MIASGRGDKVTNGGRGGFGEKSNCSPLRERGAVNLSNYKYIIQDKSLRCPILYCLSSHCRPSSVLSLLLFPNLFCLPLSLSLSLSLCFTTAAASGKLETESTAAWDCCREEEKDGRGGWCVCGAGGEG